MIEANIQGIWQSRVVLSCACLVGTVMTSWGQDAWRVETPELDKAVAEMEVQSEEKAARWWGW